MSSPVAASLVSAKGASALVKSFSAGVSSSTVASGFSSTSAKGCSAPVSSSSAGVSSAGV